MLLGGIRPKLRRVPGVVEYLALCRTVVSTAEGFRGPQRAAGWPAVYMTGDAPDAYAHTLSRAVIPSWSAVISTLVHTLSSDLLARVVLHMVDVGFNGDDEWASILRSWTQLHSPHCEPGLKLKQVVPAA